MKRSSVILLFSFVVLSIFSCDDDKQSPSVTGVWAIESEVENSNDIQRLTYTFTDNGQVEMVRSFIDKDTREILGYRLKTTGSYTTSGNSLNFFDLTLYSNDDWETPYFPLEELNQINDMASYDVTFTVGKNDTELTIQYPSCDDLANCIDKQTFIKSRIAV